MCVLVCDCVLRKADHSKTSYAIFYIMLSVVEVLSIE